MESCKLYNWPFQTREKIFRHEDSLSSVLTNKQGKQKFDQYNKWHRVDDVLLGEFATRFNFRYFNFKKSFSIVNLTDRIEILPEKRPTRQVLRYDSTYYSLNRNPILSHGW